MEPLEGNAGRFRRVRSGVGELLTTLAVPTLPPLSGDAAAAVGPKRGEVGGTASAAAGNGREKGSKPPLPFAPAPIVGLAGAGAAPSPNPTTLDSGPCNEDPSRLSPSAPVKRCSSADMRAMGALSCSCAPNCMVAPVAVSGAAAGVEAEGGVDITARTEE
jgi:hypothetical protein